MMNGEDSIEAITCWPPETEENLDSPPKSRALTEGAELNRFSEKSNENTKTSTEIYENKLTRQKRNYPNDHQNTSVLHQHKLLKLENSETLKCENKVRKCKTEPYAEVALAKWWRSSARLYEEYTEPKYSFSHPKSLLNYVAK